MKLSKSKTIYQNRKFACIANNK